MSLLLPKVFTTREFAEERRDEMLFPPAYEVVPHGNGFVIVPTEDAQERIDA